MTTRRGRTPWWFRQSGSTGCGGRNPCTGSDCRDRCRRRPGRSRSWSRQASPIASVVVVSLMAPVCRPRRRLVLKECDTGSGEIRLASDGSSRGRNRASSGRARRLSTSTTSGTSLRSSWPMRRELLDDHLGSAGRGDVHRAGAALSVGQSVDHQHRVRCHRAGPPAIRAAPHRPRLRRRRPLPSRLLSSVRVLSGVQAHRPPSADRRGARPSDRPSWRGDRGDRRPVGAGRDAGGVLDRRTGRTLDATASLLAEVVTEVARNREITRVAQVAALAQLSVRSLQRAFSEYVGAGPKWVVQRCRLQDAAARAAAAETVDWAGLADRARLRRPGPSDPGLHRDHRAVAGGVRPAGPRHLSRRIRADSVRRVGMVVRTRVR